MGRNINKFKQKMILVIGASGGLGEVVVGLLSKAHNVLAVYNSTKPKKQYENVRWIQADLRNASEIENIVSELKRGDIERVTLINLLAIKEDNLLINHDLDTWNDVLNLNVTSSFYLTKLLLPLMIDKKWGRFIFINSTGGVRGDVGTISYSTSKTAMLGFSKVVSKEYSRFNITSNVLSLGTFDTGLFHRLSKEKQKEILHSIPSKMLGNVLNITNAIEFIIKSEYVNGAVINIDGGM